MTLGGLMSCDQLEIVSTRPRFPAAFPGCVDTISSWSQDINPPRVTGHQSAEKFLALCCKTKFGYFLVRRKPVPTTCTCLSRPIPSNHMGFSQPSRLIGGMLPAPPRGGLRALLSRVLCFLSLLRGLRRHAIYDCGSHTGRY